MVHVYLLVQIFYSGWDIFNLVAGKV